MKWKSSAGLSNKDTFFDTRRPKVQRDMSTRTLSTMMRCSCWFSILMIRFISGESMFSSAGTSTVRIFPQYLKVLTKMTSFPSVRIECAPNLSKACLD